MPVGVAFSLMVMWLGIGILLGGWLRGLGDKWNR